jgi:hypothetical protein
LFLLQPHAGLAQLGDLGQLGQGGTLVSQLVRARIQLLDVEQGELGERVGFQRRLLGRGVVLIGAAPRGR